MECSEEGAVRRPLPISTDNRRWPLASLVVETTESSKGGLADQAEEEEDREASRNLKQISRAETGAAMHSHAGGLVRAANPSPNSRERRERGGMHANYVHRKTCTNITNVSTLRVNKIHLWSSRGCVLQSASEGDGKRTASSGPGGWGTLGMLSHTQGGALWIARRCWGFSGALRNAVWWFERCWVLWVLFGELA